MATQPATIPDPITYLDHAAAAGRAYKQRLLDALDLRPEHVALDIGCGPGTDLPAMAERAAEVIGVDVDPAMVDEARRRTAHLRVDVREGDAHALPLPDRGVDRARVDRVLHQVADPAAVLVELRRVLRPGGRAVLAQPDWETLAIDPGAVATNLAVNRFVCDRVMLHPVVGRQLARLATTAGLTVTSIEGDVQLLHDFDTADELLGLTRNAHRAVHAGRITRPAADTWLAELAEGPFLAAFTLFRVTVSAG
ncbi:methyltransferase domain-containing protein [Saccharothrix sp. S26]|uniref:methyltransferase domain-containing protein n=1 Tax=Saccharothrix sp. S26 TaxID=2907215 RepID=UPI001F205AA6|nr:methyltransferase domain-containing protein [Saccharothrix sp. S26]MCE6993573.1 methyltransferase domain-containing protein [Saccharothrix sp. S26]